MDNTFCRMAFSVPDVIQVFCSASEGSVTRSQAACARLRSGKGRGRGRETKMEVEENSSETPYVACFALLFFGSIICLLLRFSYAAVQKQQ